MSKILLRTYLVCGQCPPYDFKLEGKMSDLLKHLNFISDWVHQYKADCPALMNQGLSRKIIDEKVKDLPFRLPTEVYELYQWQNGGKNSFIPHPDGWDLASFPSLEESVDSAKDWDGSFNLFPLFSIEDGGYFVICTKEEREQSPIYCSDVPEEAIEHEPLYSSLTSMMEELANQLCNRNTADNNYM